jgi:hypothetical protein
MIETIENEETETQIEYLDWDESFGLFCSINKDIEFMTGRVNYYSATATYNPESLEFWNERLTRLLSAKNKLRKGVQVNTSTIKYFS